MAKEPRQLPPVEEQARQLRDLYAIRVKTERLDRVKQGYATKKKEAESRRVLLEDLTGEKTLLAREKKRLLTVLQSVQHDIEHIEERIVRVEGICKDAQKECTRLYDEEYLVLKDEIDSLRTRHGLPRLLSLDEEENREQAAYLEKRRRDGTSADTQKKSKLR